MVTDLAHHDNIGVLAQNRAQTIGKGQIDLGIDLDLPHPIELILDGVLDGDDVQFRRIEAQQRGVQGGRFPTARWASHQNDAVRAADQPGVGRKQLRLKANIL